MREKFDLAIRIGRPHEQSHVIRCVCPLRALVCASPAYLEAHGTPLVPSDLASHNCLGYTTPPETWNFVGGTQIKTGGNLNADNGDALRRAALAGLGIVYLPTFLIGDDVRAGRLEPLLVEFIDLTADVFAVYLESRHLSPKVRALIDWLAEELGPEPDWDRDLPCLESS